ncbi:hypothetical protein Naga_100195g5 [Nannochloropsis gaditana]|uniref:Uncharacterized protein n=1 Tax=Nannochloropsis gaditana TaxID=72520 RepID=W7TNE1_9STRA|nr:hypothetical protein Naga_100195g5 [Nannochloropsis gaditana]
MCSFWCLHCPDRFLPQENSRLTHDVLSSNIFLVLPSFAYLSPAVGFILTDKFPRCFPKKAQHIQLLNEKHIEK